MTGRLRPIVRCTLLDASRESWPVLRPEDNELWQFIPELAQTRIAPCATEIDQSHEFPRRDWA